MNWRGFHEFILNSIGSLLFVFFCFCLMFLCISKYSTSRFDIELYLLWHVGISMNFQIGLPRIGT